MYVVEQYFVGQVLVASDIFRRLDPVPSSFDSDEELVVESYSFEEAKLVFEES